MYHIQYIITRNFLKRLGIKMNNIEQKHIHLIMTDTDINDKLSLKTPLKNGNFINENYNYNRQLTVLDRLIEEFNVKNKILQSQKKENEIFHLCYCIKNMSMDQLNKYKFKFNKLSNDIGLNTVNQFDHFLQDAIKNKWNTNITNILFEEDAKVIKRIVHLFYYNWREDILFVDTISDDLNDYFNINDFQYLVEIKDKYVGTIGDNVLLVFNEEIKLRSNIFHVYDYIIIGRNGILTTHGYNASKKRIGILKLKVNNKLIIKSNGMISMNGKGYKGGKRGKKERRCIGWCGESYGGMCQQTMNNNYACWWWRTKQRIWIWKFRWWRRGKYYEWIKWI